MLQPVRAVVWPLFLLVVVAETAEISDISGLAKCTLTGCNSSSLAWKRGLAAFCSAVEWDPLHVTGLMAVSPCHHVGRTDHRG